MTATPDMSRLLDRVEKAGWVTRERAEDDRRQVSTYITKSGRQLLGKLETPTRDFVMQLFSGDAVSDLKTVLKVNDRIRTKLSPESSRKALSRYEKNWLSFIRPLDTFTTITNPDCSGRAATVH